MKKYLTSLLALSLLASGLANLKSNEVLAEIKESDYERLKDLKTIKWYTFDSEGNQKLSQQGDYTNDKNGNPIEIVISKANYDSGELSLVLNLKYELEYDEKENVVDYKLSKYNLEKTTFEINTENIYTYNDAGLTLTQDTYYYTEGVKNETPSQSFTYKYDTNNNLLEECTYSETVLVYKMVYEYNEKNCIVSELSYSGENLHGEIYCEYDSNNNLVKRTQFTYDNEGVMSDNYSYDYKYNENNKVIEMIKIQYSDTAKTQTNPKSYTKTEASYNGNEVTRIISTKRGKQIDYVVQSKNVTIETDTLYQTIYYNPDEASESGWVISSKATQEKKEITLEDSRVKTYTSYKYNDETNTWYAAKYNEYEYVERPNNNIPTENNFPYWVIPVGGVVILAGVYVCGYFFLFEKGKLQGKFFNAIYNWFKNLLAKLSKKKD